MQKNKLQMVTKFIFKYIWVILAILIGTELLFTVHSANILVKQTTKGMLQSVSGEVSGRVDGVLRLLIGLSKDEEISDITKPLFDRAILAKPFQESYGLYMIALTDENMNVISSDETEPPKKPYSLSYRDYMQKLYKTGEYQITDAFIAGADNKTRNYTIAVPIIKDSIVKGSVFGSIYFDDIKNIIERYAEDNNFNFYLIGQEQTIMAGNNQELIGKSYIEATKDVKIFNTSAQEISENMKQGKYVNCWEWERRSLWYTCYSKVEPTNWTIAYRVRFSSVLWKLLPSTLAKISLYIFLCVVISILGPKYLKKSFSEVNYLLDRMTAMQKELFQTESASYDSLLEITKVGLTDQLTGLSTRTVLLKKSVGLLENSKCGCLMFVDLDDLKKINDNYGHEGGDYALQHIGTVLKKYEDKYKGIAARYGGDEFIIILCNATKEEVIKAAEKLCLELNSNIKCEGKEFNIHGSIGVALYPEDGNQLEDLICKADLALYSAKRSGKNQYSSYSENKNTVNLPLL